MSLFVVNGRIYIYILYINYITYIYIYILVTCKVNSRLFFDQETYDDIHRDLSWWKAGRAGLTGTRGNSHPPSPCSSMTGGL